jgi:flagellar motor switch protein FliG
MAKDLSGLRKSAIVLLSLGEQHAAEVLRHLDRETARSVRREMKRVGKLRGVSLHTRQKVLGQFCAAAMEPAIESVVDAVLPLPAAPPPLAAPFSSFQNAGAQSLIDSIRDEHPQTIALVLAHLPHEKAGEVLAGLDHHKKVEVIKRIAGIDQTNAQVIEQVEQGLRERLSVIMGRTIPGSAGGGISVVAEILNSADRAVEEEILHDLDVDAPDLAEQIRRVQAIFEDLLVAADQDIRSVVEQLDHETIAMALRTARLDLRRKVLWNLPAEQARQLEQELEQLTPASVADIEAAQQRVAEVVHRLDSAGEIEVLDRAQMRRRKKAV